MYFSFLHRLFLCSCVLSCLVFSACSKGGAGESGTCRSMADPENQGPPSDRPISRSLYAEFKTPRGSYITMALDGIGGTYTGQKTMNKCDERGRYSLQRLVLVNAKQELVAVANRILGGSSFRVDYQDGQSTVLSDASVASSFTDFNTAVSNGAVTLLEVKPDSPKLKQGERVTVQIKLQGDECGLLKSQWWLAESSGALANKQPIENQPALQGGSGAVSLFVPVLATIGDYWIEGQVTTNSGQTLRVKRQNAADATYKLFDEKSGIYTATSYPVQKVLVLDNPDADRTAPQAVQMDAQPSRAERCQTVNLSLKLSDDRGLPTSQSIKAQLMLDDKKMASIDMSGGDILYGSYLIPSDAPGGVFYAYPELVRDAAGNEAQASFSGGKFTLTGMGIAPKAVQAATFIVPEAPARPDGGHPGPPDLGGGRPDAGSSFVATLKDLRVIPASVTRDGDSMTLQVTWSDHAGTLK